MCSREKTNCINRRQLSYYCESFIVFLFQYKFSKRGHSKTMKKVINVFLSCFKWIVKRKFSCLRWAFESLNCMYNTERGPTVASLISLRLTVWPLTWSLSPRLRITSLRWHEVLKACRIIMSYTGWCINITSSLLSYCYQTWLHTFHFIGHDAAPKSRKVLRTVFALLGHLRVTCRNLSKPLRTLWTQESDMFSDSITNASYVTNRSTVQQ